MKNLQTRHTLYVKLKAENGKPIIELVNCVGRRIYRRCAFKWIESQLAR